MNTLAPKAPYTTEFEARIERHDGRELVLDRTYFYAESGGQPADRGRIGDVSVVDVREHEDGVRHTLAEKLAFEAGDTVSCAVDPSFRTYCMCAHTASHVLYGAARGLLDDLGYGGFDIGERKVRIDFETSTEIDDALLVALERRANQAVWEGRPVTWETVSVEEARARAAVAFNTKTEEGVFGAGEGVRIVTIGSVSNGPERDGTTRGDAGSTSTVWDTAACGGTHVSNTHEIGPISVLDRSNPGEGLTRVELAVGPSAIDRRAEIRTAALRSARELGVRIEDMPEAIERRNNERAQLERERDDLLNRIADARINALGEPIERDGERWLVGSLEGVDGDALADRARELAGEETEVVAFVTEDNPVTVVVASVGETEAGTVVDQLTTEFGGGGGGGPEFAQGGGIAVDPEELVSFLREP